MSKIKLINIDKIIQSSTLVKINPTPYEKQLYKEANERIRKEHYEEAKTLVRSKNYIARTTNK